MSILSRIRAHGGEVIRDEWRFRLRAGRLSPEAIVWLRGHWREVCREVWPAFDLWDERAAILQFDAGLTRADAEAEAYARITVC
ncbi:hypothetical protein [Falsirhodobacter halotolerans]|uniref:hypothetical protein n=1 Tax=Falsirhodobacter halotolerans TaxID=1146892 RepID=UPI001FD3411D|nr:hypothetical protein [Falsirhodobacter halotolerans]MCJ8138585.1 hypothetical protein [Falsirhodobacter halotolerans]